MFTSALYLLFSLLGLGFLIFIHELGHYFMAKRAGMNVEIFSIGFGAPLWTWERDGTKWQIGWLLFGGFVKIKGMEINEKVDPYAISDGFFGKKPIARILVSFMGPAVNLLFALVAFGLLWSVGGREQNFAQHTRKIGWVDPESQLYAQGIRPGDEVLSYNGRPYISAADHIQVPMMSDGKVAITGLKFNYATKERTPFDTVVETYASPQLSGKGILTTGILAPANYIMYERLGDGSDNPISQASPLFDSGIEYGDRIAWVDGELIFSSQQLSKVLNDGKALITVVRRGKLLSKRIPRIQIRELKLDLNLKNELVDWQFEAGLHHVRFQDLYTLPYNFTADAVVEGPIKFIDENNEALVIGKEDSLEDGDKIVAVDSHRISSAHQMLSALQMHSVLVVVERNAIGDTSGNWESADADFNRTLNSDALGKIVASIGSPQLLTHAGNYQLLKPIVPKSRRDYLDKVENSTVYKEAIAEQLRSIDAMSDSESRSFARRQFEEQQQELLIGLPQVQDRKVWYNPDPIEMFSVVFSEVYHTLAALLTGALNVKWISGPVGIVQMVHEHSMGSLRNALFWLGAVSLNLGMLNLLPVPVLDGGNILFSLFEMVTGRRLKPKTMDRLIIPFAVLLIGFFIFITFNDLARIFKIFW